jgi:hypothetical protein
VSLIRSFDWAATALGPLDRWPQSLKTATALLLLSPVPIVMLWGEDGYMIYNDAYSGFAGGRHPALLGSKVREGWPEVAAFNDHVMKVGLSGQTLSYKDQELILHRSGAPETVWMNLDYSPVSAGPAIEGQDRPPDHRCGAAWRHERPPGRRGRPQLAARPEGAVHHRLRRDRHHRRHAARPGTEVLTKPFALDVLTARIRRLVES